jgi:hypothetical protein
VLDDRAHQKADPLNPQLVAYELSDRLPDDAILTADSGSATNWWAQYLKLRSGMQASLSGTLATMGPGVPYAIAAKFAYPDRPVIAMVGDGAFQMNGMNEMINVKRYWERWPDHRLVFCVFNNQDLNQVTWEQRAMAGDRKFEGSQRIPDRCGGITGLLEVSGLAAAHHIDVSGHCAPSVSAHAFCAVRRLRHVEYFHDHVRVEHLLFDGILSPRGGVLTPDPNRPGLGLAVKWPDAQRFQVR